MMTTTLDAALYYAGRGWPVFPLKPREKKPLFPTAHPEGDPLHKTCKGGCGKIGHGFGDATTDPAVIREWWGKTQEANIGIATGNKANLVVLDIDFQHDGPKSLDALVAKYGQLPETITAKTGGGGKHFLFSMPSIEIRNTDSKIAHGIDTRGEGGYICAAPSVHPSGARYQWINPPSKTELASMPGWIVELVTRNTGLTNLSVSLDGENVYAPGTRHSAFVSLAGTMRRRGMSEAAIYNALMAENRRCTPPHDEKDIRDIAAGVCKYTPSSPLISGNLDRLRLEWAFARAVYDSPANCIAEFQWLSPDMFGDDGIAKYWQLVLDGRSISAAAGEAGILLDLEKTESDPLNIDTYARQISKFGYLSGIAKAALNIQRLAETGDMERVERAIEGLKESKDVAPAVAKSALDGLMELQNEIDNPRQFIKTGLTNFDTITGGLGRGKMSILAGRPGMGKTTLGFQIARNVAASGNRTLFLSLEMRGLELWQKAAYGLAEISEADIVNNRIPSEKLDILRTEIIPEMVQVYEGKLFIYDEPPFSVMNLYKVAVNTQPDLIVIDHLRYVQQKADNEVQRLGLITQWGKIVAKKLNCHVMILAQLNRESEKRENKAPQLSDLRDSGQIEEDADLVMMPYRALYYSDDPIKERYSEMQLYIRKNRSGQVGVVGLFMDMLQQWFYRRDEIPANYKTIKL